MAGEQFDYLAVMKSLLGVTDDSMDSILQLYLDITIQSILNYCNIFELPSALNYVACQIAVDSYRADQATNSVGDVAGSVSRIEEDGRVVQFQESAANRLAIYNRITKLTELRRFKKLYRVTPEESDEDEGV